MNSIDEFKEIKFILKENNPYLILGISNSATTNEITRVYRNLAKRYHPDKFSYLENDKKINDINLVFSKINVAHDKLKNHDERRKVDRILSNQKEKINSKKITDELDLKVKTMETEILDQANIPKNKHPNVVKTSSVFNKTEALKNKKPSFLGGSNIPKKQKESSVLFSSAYRSKDDFFKENSVKFFRKGKAFLEKKEFDLAINFFQKAIDMDSKNASFHSYIGLAMKLKGWNGYAQAEFKVALFYDINDKIAKKYYKPSKKRSGISITSSLLDKLVDSLLKRMKK